MVNRKALPAISISFLIAILLALTPALVSAQIQRDGTIGPASMDILLPNMTDAASIEIDETMGAIVDSNLFHSFSEFNIGAPQTVTFTGPGGINNVISRVTGGNISYIYGDLISTIPGADFWFLNPAGVFFGSGATINIDGAFHIGAAEYLEFASGEKFTASSAWPPVLSVANPVEFGFLGAPSGTITVDGSDFSGITGASSFQDISFTSQEVNIDSGLIKPNDGYKIFINANDVSITTSSILRSNPSSASMPGGIFISPLIQAGSIFLMKSSNITSTPKSNFDSGDISITGFDNIEIRKSTIDTTVPGGTSGAAGDIILQANLEILISNCDTTLCPAVSAADTFIRSGVFRDGSGGTINIDTPSLKLIGAEISVETSSAFTDQLVVCNPCGGADEITIYSGEAGEILINADTIVLSSISGRSAKIIAATKTAGDAGIITINTQSLTLNGAAQISTSASQLGFNDLEGFGNAGNIEINADTIQLNPSSGIFSSTFSTGTSGLIKITTTSLQLDGGTISTSSTGFGNAGDIDITVGDITLLNGSSITAEFDGAGTSDTLVGGTITINATASTLNLSGGSEISTSTKTPSDAGNIAITDFDSVTITDSSITSATTGEGDAGSINILDIANLTLDGGSISVSSIGFGNTGAINITVGNITLLNGSSITAEFNTELVDPAAEPIDPVTAGDITITALTSTFIMSGGSSVSTNTNTPSDAGDIFIIGFDTLDLTDSFITSSSFSPGTGNAGSIFIGPSFNILLTNSQILTQSDLGFGGNIQLQLTNLLFLVDSEISTSVFDSSGGGGNIDISNPLFFIMNSSFITANAIFGDGGDINILSDFLFMSPDSFITATSQGGVDGTINSDSPESDTTSGTTALKVAYQDSSNLLKKSCALQSADETSGSLVVAKSRGLPASPEEMLMSYDPGVMDQTSSSFFAVASAFGKSDEEDDEFKPVQVASAMAIKEGAKAFRGGDFDMAEERWTEASRLYSESGNHAAHGAALQKLGQAQQVLGKYQESLATLSEALKIATDSGDQAQQASLLASMGNANIALGNSQEAEELLTRGMRLAIVTENNEVVTASLNNMGNFYSMQGNYQKAMDSYRESAESAKANGQKIEFAKAVSNEARVAISAGEIDRVRELLEGTRAWTMKLDDSTDKAYILVHLAKSYELLAERSSENRALGLMGAHDSLHAAIKVSESIGENRARSFALGNLGKLYLNSQRHFEALYLTRQALGSALKAQAPDSIYRWHWQEGKILWAIDKRESAINSYKRAVKILDETRQESMVRYSASAGYFNKVISPVYLDLVDALIQVGQSSGVTELAAQSLLEARNAMEQLKAAELREYFKDECVAEFEAKETKLDTVSQSAAVVYPIMLPDRIDILVSLPSGMKRYSSEIGSVELTKNIKKFRKYLQTPGSDNYLSYSKKLYDILVRPYARDMEQEGIHTIVFLPHAALHSIPIAALHDGEQFLAQKYALAVTPSLALVDPKPLDRTKIKLLLAGISDSVQGMPALPAVPQELAAIQKLLGGDILLNQDFTLDNFKKALGDKEVTIVHIASHGSFTGNENGNFLLAFDGKLSINQLNKSIGQTKFRENPIELLVLSACETAAGDEKAALGLAGAAIQAGARSVMGSLWSVSDEGTAQLVEEFYRQLKDPTISKAKALQRAQTKLMQNEKFQHPYFWSPFLMINNWL